TRSSAQMDDLECEICCDLYDDADSRPKVLLCGHTFCSTCMAKEISKGKRTCPTCRIPHNATSVNDFRFNVTVERLIRNMPENLRLGTNALDSEDEEDEYSGGPCSKHRKSVVYFFCQTHSLEICRECTVINHPVTKCKIISFEDDIKMKKDEAVQQANSDVRDMKYTISALGDIVKVKDDIISKQEIEIQQYKKAIEDATKIIAKEKAANDHTRHEIAQGTVKEKNMEAAIQKLINANRKKTICEGSSNVKTTSNSVRKWIKDVREEYNILHKDISNGSSISAETTVEGRKATAKLSSKDGKLHAHSFKYDISQKGAKIVQYEKVLSHLCKPLTLLFMDLSHRTAYQGRVYIRLRPELDDFIKNIPHIFTGKEGNYILGNTCIYSGGLHLWFIINKPVNGISKRNGSDFFPKYGEVFCYSNGTSIQYMHVCVSNASTMRYGSAYSKIGYVEAGLEVAKSCRGKGWDEQEYITISDCGLVLEM
ncbi:unnamed protein product, partial [Meganyctiphanes norvegica]